MYYNTGEVNLYYEVCGSGRPLLLLHGVVTDSGLYQHAAEILSGYYQVITYDRRGNSRSTQVFKEDFSIAAQVRDAKALLDALKIEKTFLCGASAGAIVAQELLKAHPNRISHLLMYEPPLVSLLEEKEEDRVWLANIEGMIQQGKVNHAILEFMLSLGNIDDRRKKRPDADEEREIGNFKHFLNQEFQVFMHYQPDIGYYQQKAADITIAIGEQSGETRYVRAARRFSEIIGRQPLHFPGCHNLPVDLPEDFANCLMGLMAKYRW